MKMANIKEYIDAGDTDKCKDIFKNLHKRICEDITDIPINVRSVGCQEDTLAKALMADDKHILHLVCHTSY